MRTSRERRPYGVSSTYFAIVGGDALVAPQALVHCHALTERCGHRSLRRRGATMRFFLSNNLHADRRGRRSLRCVIEPRRGLAQPPYKNGYVSTACRERAMPVPPTFDFAQAFSVEAWPRPYKGMVYIQRHRRGRRPRRPVDGTTKKEHRCQ